MTLHSLLKQVIENLAQLVLLEDQVVEYKADMTVLALEVHLAGAAGHPALDQLQDQFVGALQLKTGQLITRVTEVKGKLPGRIMASLGLKIFQKIIEREGHEAWPGDKKRDARNIRPLILLTFRITWQAGREGSTQQRGECK